MSRTVTGLTQAEGRGFLPPLGFRDDCVVTLNPGMKFKYRYDDGDASDEYSLQVESVGETVRYRWQLEGCPDSGEIQLTASSIAKPIGMIWFSQGAVTAGHEEVVQARDATVTVDGYLPPFSSSPWDESGSLELQVNYQSVVLERTDDFEGVEVQVAGAAVQIQGRIWRSADEESYLVVSQDDRAPGVLQASFDGGTVELDLLSVD